MSLSLCLAFSPVAHAKVVKRKRIADGVLYRHMIERNKRQDYHVVSVALPKPSRLRVALSNEALAGLERTSSMARRMGAIVAINGDYARPTGRPVMTFARRPVDRAGQPAWTVRPRVVALHSGRRGARAHPETVVLRPAL